jgi:hypothetical protein
VEAGIPEGCFVIQEKEASQNCEQLKNHLNKRTITDALLAMFSILLNLGSI